MLDCNLYTCMCMCIYTYNNVHTLPFTTRTVNHESEKWMRSEWRVFQARIWIFGPGAACASRRPELRNCLAYERLAAWKQAKQAKQALLSRFGSVLSVLLHFALGNSQMSLDVSCLFLFFEFYWSHWSQSLGAPIFEVSLQVTDCEQGLFRQSLDAPKLQQLRKDAGDSLGSRWIQLDPTGSMDQLWLHAIALSNWLQLFWLWCVWCACLCALAVRAWHQLLLSAGY